MELEPSWLKMAPRPEGYMGILPPKSLLKLDVLKNCVLKGFGPDFETPGA